MAFELSAILVAGPCRSRSQRVVDALCAQTASESMEIIIVDLASASIPRLMAGPKASVVYLSRPDIQRWGQARAEAVRAAHAPVMAFIEDHCFPARHWAEKLIEAHAGPWAAVGYAFTNANPQSYISRAAMLARYGLFAHPARSGPARYISGNNVSYKRDILLQLGERLETFLDIDFNLQEELIRKERPMFVEARALAAHQNYTSLAGECRTGRPYCRLLAANRARVNAWGKPRCLLYGLLAPLWAPVVRLVRLAYSLRNRSALWPAFVTGFPWIIAMYLSDAVGESAGYLLGSGDAEREVLKYELETERDLT
ncbi:MAG: glycosyltransferase [Deltaproteobacteria bacterium]|nr:glycosyltransferase [Deltaproteobacteria bacterium]